MAGRGSPSKALQSCEQQKAVLATFGSHALNAENLDALLHEATVGVAAGLGVDRAKIMELVEGGSRLLIRTGIGWDPGVVGHVTIGADSKSPGGYALRTKEPVISEDLGKEKRFEVPEVLKQHGIVSSVNVIIDTKQGPFGILEVDSAKRRKFTDADINFLQGYANLLSGAIHRLRTKETLEQIAKEKEMLFSELEHRVRNNISSILALISIQRRKYKNIEVHNALDAIFRRIETLRLVHEKLHTTDSIGKLNFGIYLRDLSAGLFNFHGSEADGIKLDLQLDDIDLNPDKALPLGMIANEFITNSLKYAFPEGQGTISIILRLLQGDRARLTLADDGVGMKARSASSETGLGLQIIPMLASQAQAGFEWSHEQGTRLTLIFSVV